jgi:hypothetical protein
MPIAVKNDALIITGGKLAENCACCGSEFCTSLGYPKQGSGVGRCYCYCTANGGTVPQFVNVTLSYRYETNYAHCNTSDNRTFTLTRTPQSIKTDQFVNGLVSGCYAWLFTSSDFYASVTTTLNPNEVISFYFQYPVSACASSLAPPYYRTATSGYGELFLDRLTTDGGLGTGTCFSRFAGSTLSFVDDILLETVTPSMTGTFSWTATINGFA